MPNGKRGQDFWINQLIVGAVGVSLAIPANYNSETCQNVSVFCAFMGIAAIGTFQEMVPFKRLCMAKCGCVITEYCYGLTGMS